MYGSRVYREQSNHRFQVHEKEYELIKAGESSMSEQEWQDKAMQLLYYGEANNCYDLEEKALQAF